MFKTRLLSGIMLVIVLVITVGFGGNLLLAVSAVISIIGMTELYKVVKAERTPVAVAGYLAAIIYYAMVFVGHTDLLIYFAIFFLIVLMAVYVFTFPKYRGKGYGTLICDEMLTYVVKEWNSKIITLCVKPENVIAYQVYTKMGFNKISTKRIFLIYKYIIPRYRI